MSADNWTACPRCLDNAKAEAASERKRVMALYGQVPVDEFDAARTKLVDIDPDADRFQTFREDYEFYGASEGEVIAVYSGACTACGLNTDLKASQPFYTIASPNDQGAPSQ